MLRLQSVTMGIIQSTPLVIVSRPYRYIAV